MNAYYHTTERNGNVRSGMSSRLLFTILLMMFWLYPNLSIQLRIPHILVKMLASSQAREGMTNVGRAIELFPKEVFTTFESI